jgi:hypothetical protein
VAIGSCDACNAQNVRIHRADTCGIETYACAKCCGEPPCRCETNECDPGGECMNCGAVSGEACRA